MHHAGCMAALNPTWFRAQMNADLQDFKHKEITEKTIKIFYRVYNKLGNRCRKSKAFNLRK
jgi:hypothetical protein